MATESLHHDAHAEEHERHDAGPTKVFGFWVYLMSELGDLRNTIRYLRRAHEGHGRWADRRGYF